jgi:hypothetical protein
LCVGAYQRWRLAQPKLQACLPFQFTSGSFLLEDCGSVTFTWLTRPFQSVGTVVGAQG